MSWSMSCDQCGRVFADGIDAGTHEIDNPGHSVHWSNITASEKAHREESIARSLGALTSRVES